MGSSAERVNIAVGKKREVFDAVIVGAGPAGLSAALVLGRACRKVLLCDNDTPRNWASKAIYGFLTRDGTAPADFRKAAGLELRRYPNITRARKLPDGMFEVSAGRRTVRSRKILIATGVIDQLPAIPGIESFFGTSVFQCPSCDGWELRRAPVAVHGWCDPGALCAILRHGLHGPLAARGILGMPVQPPRRHPLWAIRGEECFRRVRRGERHQGRATFDLRRGRGRAPHSVSTGRSLARISDHRAWGRAAHRASFNGAVAYSKAARARLPIWLTTVDLDLRAVRRTRFLGGRGLP